MLLTKKRENHPLQGNFLFRIRFSLYKSIIIMSTKFVYFLHFFTVSEVKSLLHYFLQYHFYSMQHFTSAPFSVIIFSCNFLQFHPFPKAFTRFPHSKIREYVTGNVAFGALYWRFGNFMRLHYNGFYLLLINFALEFCEMYYSLVLPA